VRLLKSLFFLSLILMIGIVWLLALYLNSLAERDEARSHLQETKQTIGQETDTALLKTVEGFCRELYGPQPDRARIASYTTPRGKSVFLPPEGKEAKSNIQIQMKIHSISVYSGVVKEKQVEVIAAVNRTTTINGIAATSTSYVRLELVKKNTWLVDTGVIIGETPSK